MLLLTMEGLKRLGEFSYKCTRKEVRGKKAVRLLLLRMERLAA